MFFKAKGGGNVLTQDAFQEIYEFDTKFRRSALFFLITLEP
jgi:hypothetical protein